MARQFKYEAVVNVFNEVGLRAHVNKNAVRWGFDKGHFDHLDVGELIKVCATFTDRSKEHVEIGLEVEDESCMEAFPEQIPDIAIEGRIPAAHAGAGDAGDARGMGPLVNAILYTRVSKAKQATKKEIEYPEFLRKHMEARHIDPDSSSGRFVASAILSFLAYVCEHVSPTMSSDV